MRLSIANMHWGDKAVEVTPKKPAGEVHIYLGVCGYKLSTGNRHLNLAELAWICEKLNETTWQLPLEML